MKTIGILGAGWGIALAVLLHKNGHQVSIWTPFEEEIATLSKERESKKTLPGVRIPDDVTLTNDLREAVWHKDLVVVAGPSQFTRKTAQDYAAWIEEGQIVLTVSKGIEESSLKTMAEVLEEVLPQAKVAVMTGPSHAEEVGRGLPTAIVVGARQKSTAKFIQSLFMNDTFRVYTSPDVLGMELGSSLKNVVALAAGIADGLGYGDNAKAALITRGIHEIAQLGIALGGKYETFYGLTGIGDLIVTCASLHSRNRRAGMLIGQGYTMKEAMDEVQMMVEGVFSAKAALALANQVSVEMPIVEQVNQVLFHEKPADLAVRELMGRDAKTEISSLPWEVDDGDDMR
ncbi:MAG: NAD(P)-dependent glycerol-3-phosphate dehydrogenase [Clostridium sp.]|jgi:glycerol-3-phosphate dehydrogenase (NAD(P)+)|nr:NAD(P)-dependent glycerol-3-phosphate dehydrogenase [Clostridium sp.]